MALISLYPAGRLADGMSAWGVRVELDSTESVPPDAEFEEAFRAALWAHLPEWLRDAVGDSRALVITFAPGSPTTALLVSPADLVVTGGELVGSSDDDESDGEPMDRTPTRCWRCDATEVPPADVIGLCPPCLTDLQPPTA